MSFLFCAMVSVCHWGAAGPGRAAALHEVIFSDMPSARAGHNIPELCLR